MNKFRKLSFLIAFVLVQITQLCLAQPGTDEQLAAQFYQNKEFDKALVYYEKLYAKKNNSSFYKYYIDCLIETKEFKEAEKVVRKRIKLEPSSLNYQVDLGYVFQRSGNETKAKEEYERAISLLKDENNQIFVVGKAFITLQLYDLAIKTYEKGRKLMKGTYPFNFEIAQVHGMKGDHALMIGELLDVLLINESYKQGVEDALLPFFEETTGAKRVESLKGELLKRTQKYPDKTIFAEMFIWLLEQQREFEAAFIQVKALDKRLKESGGRVMELASMCVANDVYEVAIKAYQYVLTKGSGTDNYLSARMELLNVLYKKVTGKNDFTQEELIELEKNYQQALLPTELGKSSGTVSLIKNLAHIQAFYLNKTEEPIALLEEALQLPGLGASANAECKLELADVLLMKGLVWDASLMYSQVEKAFKHDPVGHEAKFRNARLSYFIGDFKWAQSQLDVLKGSTSKLIANDAMDLSLLISDNSTIDTNLVPLLMYSRADLLYYRNDFEAAIQALDSLKKLFPNHALADEILYKKFQIASRRGKTDEAIVILELILKDYSWDIYADDACFKLGDIYEFKLNDVEKAKKYYEELLLKFPGSLYSVEARKRFRRLRGDHVN